MIFHNPSFHRIKVTVRDVVAPIFVLQTVAAVILLVWTITSPPRWVRRVTEMDRFGRVVETWQLFLATSTINYAIKLPVRGASVDS